MTETDNAYLERNQLVAALARLFPSGLRATAIDGWDPEWNGCVFIDLPTGQVSWHYHDREAHLFAGLPAYTKPWDGHTTPEKYQRLADLHTARQPLKILESAISSIAFMAPERGAEMRDLAATALNRVKGLPDGQQ